MQIDMAREIFEIVKILPQDKQKIILEQAEELAEAEPKLSIWDRIIESGKSIPDEVWAELPVDGSEQLDHYLYGSPKK